MPIQNWEDVEEDEVPEMELVVAPPMDDPDKIHLPTKHTDPDTFPVHLPTKHTDPDTFRVPLTIDMPPAEITAAPPAKKGAYTAPMGVDIGPGERATYGLDPRVLMYLQKVTEGDRAIGRQAQRDNWRTNRQQLFGDIASGIAGGAAQIGTTFGETPGVKPFTDQMAAQKDTAEQYRKNQLNNLKAERAKDSEIDKRVLEYLMPKAKGGAAGKGTWKQIVVDGKRVWKYLPNEIGSQYDAPMSAAAGQWYKGFYPNTNTPAYVRQKPDGDMEYIDRDPGTRMITTVGPDGNPVYQIVPDIATVPGPKGTPRRTTPAQPYVPGGAAPQAPAKPVVTTPQAPATPKPGQAEAPLDAEPSEGYPKWQKPERPVPIETYDKKTGQTVVQYVSPETARELKSVTKGPPDSIVTKATEKRASARDLINALTEMRYLYSTHGKNLFVPGSTSAPKSRWELLKNEYAKKRERFNNPGNQVTLTEAEIVEKYAAPSTVWEKLQSNPEKVTSHMNAMMDDVRRETNNYLEESGLEPYFKDVQTVPDIAQPGGREPGPTASPQAPIEAPQQGAAGKPIPKRDGKTDVQALVVGEIYRMANGAVVRWDGKRFMPVGGN